LFSYDNATCISSYAIKSNQSRFQQTDIHCITISYTLSIWKAYTLPDFIHYSYQPYFHTLHFQQHLQISTFTNCTTICMACIHKQQKIIKIHRISSFNFANCIVKCMLSQTVGKYDTINLQHTMRLLQSGEADDSNKKTMNITILSRHHEQKSKATARYHTNLFAYNQIIHSLLV